jgi:hypothetical protein
VIHGVIRWYGHNSGTASRDGGAAAPVKVPSGPRRSVANSRRSASSPSRPSAASAPQAREPRAERKALSAEFRRVPFEPYAPRARPPPTPEPIPPRGQPLVHGCETNDKSLPGSPDIALPKPRKAILVHGCFWYVHSGRLGMGVPRPQRVLEGEARAERPSRPALRARAARCRLGSAGRVGVRDGGPRPAEGAPCGVRRGPRSGCRKSVTLSP